MTLDHAIQIKPHPAIACNDPLSGRALETQRILWQGIHVCSVAPSADGKGEWVSDFPVGQAVYTPYQVHLPDGELYGSDEARSWFGDPLRQSLLQPRDAEIPLVVERFKDLKSVVILNCIDYLYGHSLLKLLNIEELLDQTPAVTGVVVMVQPCLRWLVPEGVAEVWQVELPFSQARAYHPSLHAQIERECERFDEIRLSRAFSHPRAFNIERLTRIPRHDLTTDSFRITFIWREARGWPERGWRMALARVGKAWGFDQLAQRHAIIRLFSVLRERWPSARFTVAGLGRRHVFPEWIDDCRVARFDAASEKETCQVYAESRMVIGPHGSNMLLPSAHAGMVVDLMPEERWGNLAQDILYQPPDPHDPRIVSLRYRYLPADTSLRSLAVMIDSMLRGFPTAAQVFCP